MNLRFIGRKVDLRTLLINILETLDKDEVLEVNYKDVLTEVDIETGSAFLLL